MVKILDISHSRNPTPPTYHSQSALGYASPKGDAIDALFTVSRPNPIEAKNSQSISSSKYDLYLGEVSNGRRGLCDVRQPPANRAVPSSS